MAGSLQTLKNQLIKIKKNTCEIWFSYKVLHLEEDLIHLFVPRLKDANPELKHGEEIKVICPGNKCRVMYDTIVHSVKGNIVSIPYPEQSIKIQERKYVRAEVKIPVTYTLPRHGGAPPDCHQGIVRDLSEGGAKITTGTFLTIGTELQLRIRIPGNEAAAPLEANLPCKVMHSKIAEHRTYEAGLKFVGISPELRRRILRFVFDKMAERKKNIEIQEIVTYFEPANL